MTTQTVRTATKVDRAEIARYISAVAEKTYMAECAAAQYLAARWGWEYNEVDGAIVDPINKALAGLPLYSPEPDVAIPMYCYKISDLNALSAPPPAS